MSQEEDTSHEVVDPNVAAFKPPTFLPDDFSGDETLCWPRPYLHAYESNVKGRWIGRTAVDVFAAEFPYYTRDFYESQRAAGRLSVKRGGNWLTADDIATLALRTGDVVRHQLHRHETPVWNSGPIQIIGFAPATTLGVFAARSTDGVVCVAKPPTLPVHPCGRYHKASLTGLIAAGHVEVAASARAQEWHYSAWLDQLRSHFRLEAPHTVHRLDKATGGVVLLATSRAASAAVFAALSEKSEEPSRATVATAEAAGEGSAETAAASEGDNAAAAATGKRGRSPTRPGASSSEPAEVVSTGVAATDSGARPVAATKTYLARVRGRFPGGGAAVVVDRAVYCASHREGRFACVSEADEEARRRRLDSAARRDVQEQVGAAKRDAMLLSTVGAGAASSSGGCQQATPATATAAAAAWERKRAAQREATEQGATGGADCEGPESAKWARTTFRLRRYVAADDTSVVEAEPETGRTHQIRLHAALLGHPILLDGMYSARDAALTDAEREEMVRRLFGIPLPSFSFPREAPSSVGDDGKAQWCVECQREAADAPALQAATDREFWSSFICLHAHRYRLRLNPAATRILDFHGEEPLWAAEERSDV